MIHIHKYIYFDCETRLFSQDEIDTLLTVFEGSIINRFKLLIKRIILFNKNISDYKLIIIRNKFVYIIGLNGIKNELSEDSIYSYFMVSEKNGE